ncbi:MAG: hypothetical protein HFJ66_07570 [Eggerthellaceae bacterium]|nr:hypothetical protein [Eggerthellaceae bacterium]
MIRPDAQLRRSRKGTRGNSAFFLEMTLLLLFAAVSLAIVFSLMGSMVQQARYNQAFNQAMTVATSYAESAAAGADVPAETQVEGFTVRCTAREAAAGTGALEALTIQVVEGDSVVYSFDTCSYQAGGER